MRAEWRMCKHSGKYEAGVWYGVFHCVHCHSHGKQDIVPGDNTSVLVEGLVFIME